MSTRREFIQKATMVTLAGAISADSVLAADEKKEGIEAMETEAKAGGTAAEGIRSVTARDETLRRVGGGGMFPGLTWSADDQQLLPVVEGAGWPGLPKDLYVESALVAVSGQPENVQFHAVPGFPYYPIRECYRVNGSPVYSSSTALAVDGHIYFFCSAFGDAWKIVGDYFVLHKDRGQKLIYSPDNGRTWRNQNGSSPVVWETAKQQSSQTMALWKEPQDALAGLSFLQMGRDYRDNRDGYVYIYGLKGGAKVNELAMFRVPKTQVLDRGFYEYFAGLQSAGAPKWTKDISARAAVHSFPLGSGAYGDWHLGSVAYNAPLGVYMMVGFIGGLVEFLNINEFELPKNVLGLWTARNPWGPWTQVAEIDPWFPGGDFNAHVLSLTIAPKWISEDGKSFWIVWCDVQHSSDWRPEIYKEWLYAKTDDEATRLTVKYRATHPQVRFNTQRVDLNVA